MLIPTPYDKAFYAQYLRDELPGKLFDGHVHLFQKKHLLHLSPGADWALGYAERHPMDAREYAQAMEAMFPGKQTEAACFGWVGRNVDVPANNGYIAGLCEEGFCGLMVVTPETPPDEIAVWCAQPGAVGLKPYPVFAPASVPPADVTIFDMMTPAQWDAANSLELAVVLHLPRPGRIGDQANLEQLLRISRDFPRVKTVVAHLGRAYCPCDIQGVLEALDGANLYFDFAANTNEDVMRAFLRTFGHSRIHFGTDLPITHMHLARECSGSTYVNHVWQSETGCGENEHTRLCESDLTYFAYECAAAMVRALDCCEGKVEDVFYNNAAALFKGRE